MVLESFSEFMKKAPKFRFFLMGFIYLSIAMLLAMTKFRSSIGMVMLFLTVLAAAPFFYTTIRHEEEEDVKERYESTILASHIQVLEYFMMFFFGVTLAAALWFVILPSSFTFMGGTFETVEIFKPQLDAIQAINPELVGNATSVSTSFLDILSHNLEILVLCILFSFIYGLGAIFIITWNSTVLGVAIGSFIKAELATLASVTTTQYSGIVAMSILRFAIHGIPEILAFFTAGLAGGIISVAVIRHHLFSKKANMIIADSSLLIIISLVLLVFAALLEVFATPLFF